MLRQTVGWSLGRPWLVVWICLWLGVLGGFYVSDMAVDFLPAIEPAQVTVDTEANGLVAQQVEATVTRPIEAVLLGTPGVAHVESQSVQGLSVVTLRFVAGTDASQVRQGIAQNLARVGPLPAGTTPPALSPLIAPGPGLMEIGFSGGKDAIALRQVVQWLVRPRLLATPGVARVAVYGGQIPQIVVRARPADLSDSGLGFLDIVAAARRATSLAGAGFIDTPNQRVLIEPHGQAETIDAVKDGQIQTSGSDPVRIDDVADVSETAAPSYGDALIAGQPAVIVRIDQNFGTNTIAATHALEQALDVLRPSLMAQGVTIRTDIDRPATFVAASAEHIAEDFGIGVALVALALVILLRDARVVIVSLAAVPLTFILTLAALKALGLTLNVMTLGGLAVALGLVIDDIVIDIESILSDLVDAERRHTSRRDAIVAASLEVRVPVFSAMLALVLMLVPLLFLRGPEQALLAPLAGAIIIASGVSLIVAMTVTPALALLLFRHIRPQPRIAAVERFKAMHGRMLKRGEQWSWPLLIGAGALTIGAAAALVFYPSKLMPALYDGHIVAVADAAVSTSPEAVRKISSAMAGEIGTIAGVRTVSQRMGRDPAVGDTAEIGHSAIDVELQPDLSGSAQANIGRQIQRRLADYASVADARSRYDAGDAGSHGAPSLEVSVHGQDLAAVDEAAKRIAAVLPGVAGAATVRPPTVQRGPVVRVDLNFNKLALFGLSASDVLDTVQAAFAGAPVASIYQGSQVEDLVVIGQDSVRQDPESVGDLLLRSTSGFSVPLRSVANVYLTDGRTSIEHEGGVPRELVTAVPHGSDIDVFARNARAAIIQQVKLPPGIFITYELANSAALTRQHLALAYALGVFSVFTYLAVVFDGATSLLVLLSTGFAFIGGAIAIALLGDGLSIGPIAGLIALIGLSLRNAMLVISEAEDVALAGKVPWTFATATQAITDRAVPVVVSSVLVILALAPMAIDSGAAGLEIVGPMAIVIIAGVITAVVGDLFVLPLMLWKFWTPRAGRLARSDDGLPTRAS